MKHPKTQANEILLGNLGSMQAVNLWWKTPQDILQGKTPMMLWEGKTENQQRAMLVALKNMIESTKK
jgi:hypothetical protein